MKSLAKWFAKRAQIRQIERELHSYSDRELEDMGIDRYRISAIARGKYTNESRIRTAFESGFADLNYSISAFFKRLWLRLLNHWQHGGSQKAAQNLVMQNRHKEARNLLEKTEKTIQARRRLIRQSK